MNERFKPGDIFKSLRIEIIAGILGLLLLLGGIISILPWGKDSSQIEIIPATKSAEVQGNEIVVDVAGAVLKPGVYRVPLESRVGEAINLAGGFSGEADHGYISKNINLAAKLKDGLKIYIPRSGESYSSSPKANLNQTVAGVSNVNLNTGSLAELESLPGIGPVTAAKIINSRPFSQVDELLSRKVVGQSVYGKIKDLVSVF